MIWILPYVTTSDNMLSFDEVNDPPDSRSFKVTNVLYVRTVGLDLLRNVDRQTSHTILRRTEQPCQPTTQPSSNECGETMLSYLDK
jgi:hypothetical protein